MIDVRYPTYSLRVDGASVGVCYDGTEIARLDVRSAVHMLSGDYAQIRDEEPEVPALAEDRISGACRTFVWKGKSGSRRTPGPPVRSRGPRWRRRRGARRARTWPRGA